MSPAVYRVRVLLAAAAGPLLTGYTALAALLAVVNALAPQAHFSIAGVLLAAGPGWLAAYQVPLMIDGQPLGVLPLTLTAGAAYLVARAAGEAAERLRLSEPRESIMVIGPMTAVHGLAGSTVAVLANGTAVTAQPLAAFAMPALIGGVAATAGVARRCGLLPLAGAYVDSAAVHGLRAARLSMAGLLAVASAVFAVSSVLSAPTMHGLFVSNAPGFGSGAGMLLLSLLYLPNALLAALAFVTGPGFDLGSAWVSPFGFRGGAVPGVPLLAGLPEAYQGWWPLLVVLPVLVGALVGWLFRAVDPDPMVRLRVVTVAGALIGFGCVVLGTFAGGQLGTGAFRAVVIPVGLFSLAAFCWVTVPAALVVWFAGPRRPQPAEPGESDIPGGELDVAGGELDVAEGELDGAGGELDVADGELDVAGGELDVADGELDVAGSELDVAGSESDVPVAEEGLNDVAEER